VEPRAAQLAEMRSMRLVMEALAAEAKQERTRADDEAAARARSEKRDERLVRFASRTYIVGFAAFVVGLMPTVYLVVS
jgi:hypothetical protein